MKLKEKHKFLKAKYNDYIILLKSGSFYVTFDIDALILNRLFKYQVVNNKVGFPINSINKIEEELKIKNINYVIDNNEEDIIKYSFENNEYISQFGEAKKSEFKENLNNLLIEQIKNLLEYDSSNYDKIRRFIDEL